jgi:hypothetical protein
MELTIHTSRTGQQFAYVGDYTLRMGRDGAWDVTRDVDGDEVRIAVGLPLNEAVVVAKLAKFSEVAA